MELIAPHKRSGWLYACNRIVPHKIGWVAAIVFVFVSGLCFRAVTSRLNLSLKNPIVLPIPLTEIPKDIGDWVGQDVSLPEAILRIAGNDDYVYRIYRNTSTGQWVNVYVSYSGRPRTMIGHRPTVCYGAAGWVCDSTIQAEFQRTNMQIAPCLIHRFYRPGPDSMDIVVLNYYILNGKIINNEDGFSGLAWRTPNIAGQPARYVAQVQISSVLESPVRSAAESMTDLICDYLPDEDGFVKAAQKQTRLTTASFAVFQDPEE